MHVHKSPMYRKCTKMVFCLGVPKSFSVNNFGVANPKCTILHKNTPILLGLDRK